MSEFPLGASVGRWRIVETLYGGPDRGMYRGDGRVLVTMGPPQQERHDGLRSRLATQIAGVTPLLAIETIVGEGVPYDVLVEAEPDGAPVTFARPSDALGVSRGLARCVANAHASGIVLGGIRPELVYASGDAFSGLAPRAEPFLSGARPRSYGVPPCFHEVYASPEALALAPTTTASDVFSLAATIVYLLDGRPPFEGAALHERMSAALHGRTRALALPAPILAALAPTPSQRPDADALVAAL